MARPTLIIVLALAGAAHALPRGSATTGEALRVAGGGACKGLGEDECEAAVERCRYCVAAWGGKCFSTAAARRLPKSE